MIWPSKLSADRYSQPLRETAEKIMAENMGSRPQPADHSRKPRISWREFYLVEAKDINEAAKIAAKIPGARIWLHRGRPIMQFSLSPVAG
jgi:hypothetical protein